VIRSVVHYLTSARNVVLLRRFRLFVRVVFVLDVVKYTLLCGLMGLFLYCRECRISIWCSRYLRSLEMC
jgi:hypothetical protein